ncbi:MAG: ATP-binding protein [Myxococcales bacterium]|nr:ATP-binding protein [Myxococcales bacterium]MDD9966396.1 ATP-binding protein [Myxococcales bacterium]
MSLAGQAIPRVAVSGGPGAGKTTVLREALRRDPKRFVGVSEVATLMFTHVFPKVHTATQRRAIQHAIFHTQLSLEDFHGSRAQPNQVLLCDRGTPDGGGYWPEGHAGFFAAMRTTLEAELGRYDAVVFLESAAAGGLSIASGNPIRSEDRTAAVEIDQRLRAVWSAHPNYTFIPHAADFRDKIEAALDALMRR